MTDNMKEFMDANNDSPVIFGEIIHDELFYKLENGGIYLLTKEDIQSAPDFTPNWGI